MERGSLTDSLTETLAQFDSGEPRTTTELADALDLGRRSTYDRLERLVDRGRLRTKKVGANARVWWRPRDGEATSADGAAGADGSDGAGFGGDGHEEFESLVAAVEEYAIFRLDTDGTVRTWNPGARRIKGFERSDIVGEHFSKFYTEEARANDVPERNLTAAANEGSIEDEGWRVRADGTTFWANVTITAIRDDDGELEGFAKVTRDMTERREYERRLQAERDFTQRILETAPASIFVLERDGEVSIANERFESQLGVPDVEGELSVGDVDVYDEAGQFVPPAERPYRTIFETGEPVRDWRCEIERPDGERRWVTVNVDPIVDDGRVERAVVTAQDVTKLRRQEQRLERERDELRSELDDVFTRIDDAFFALDSDWRFVHVNDRAAVLLDRSAEKLIGSSLWEEFPAAVVSRFEERYRHAMATQESVSFQEYHPPLSSWLQVHAYPSEEGLSVYFRDVTERVEREHELERYETVVETMDDGVYVVDADGRFTMVNDAYAEMVDRDAEELLGSSVETVIDDEAVLERAREIEADLRDGSRATRTIEAELGGEDGEPVIGEATFALLADEEGYERVGVVRDVTERKERERELELYGTLFEESRDVNAVLDEQGDFEYVTPSASNVLGHEPADLLGENAFEYVHEADREMAFAEFSAMVEDPAYEPTVEFRFRRADGSWAVMEARARNLLGDPDIRGIVVYTRDVTERRERERELEEARRRYSTLLENFPNGAVGLIDEDLRYQAVGGTPVDEGIDSPDDLEGESVDEVLTPELREVVLPRYEDALAGEASAFEVELGDRHLQFRAVPVRDDDGAVFAALVMSQDITERKESERKLRRRVEQQHVVTELGRRALETDDLDELMADATRLVAETLDNDYCKVLDLDREAEELLLRQGVGWDEGIVGSATVSTTEDDSQAAYTLASEEPVKVDELSTESRFSGPSLLRDHDVASGISTVIGPHEDPWGILGTHDTERREFSDHDVNFVQSVANILASAINRHRDERQLLAQRERLEALNSLNQVVREITDVVIEQSTREEIEETVCAHLAESDSYTFAWIGETDPSTETVRPRTEAGAEGYLDDITITIDPDDDRSGGPTGRALRSGEVQVANDVEAESAHDPWRDHVDEYDFRSSAAIPIVHQQTVYGALNVYADRPGAFAGEERTVIEQLGEIVGHAIAAVERKRALMSDEVVELVFQVEDVFGTLGIDADAAGPIRLEHTVETGTDEFVLYGSTTPACADAVETMVADVPFYEDVVFRESADGLTFEIRASEPPILSRVASLGGSVEDAVIEDGEFRTTIHMSPSADVRGVIDAMMEQYPSATLLKRRQLTKDVQEVDTQRRAFMSTLTDRQRAAIEAAYHAGFFEWPRSASGEDVAEALGVASPTFHQHLRKAEGKVFDALLSGE